MKINLKTFYIAAYTAALVAALLMRFTALARAPLSDSEAVLALQALNLAQGRAVQYAPHPGYLTFTSLLFFLFGSSDFLARFWPALAGSLLALAPALFRRWMGEAAALALAFFLAFDPGLAAASRTIGSPILAVTFLTFAAGFTLNRRGVLAGICAGLALLSGPQVWPGLVILALLAWAASRWLRPGEAGAAEAEPVAEVGRPAQSFYRNGLIALAVALVLVGTLFFRLPGALGAAFSSLVTYLSGWVRPQGTQIGLVLAALGLYELFALLAGVTGLISGLLRRDPVERLLGTALLLGLLLALVYPSRQVMDLLWVVLPLAALAARLLVRWLSPQEVSLAPALAEAILTVVLLVFAWLNLSALANPSTEEPALRAAAMWSAVGLLLITSVLMVWGWSLLAMRTGMTAGLALLLSLFTLSAAVNAAGMGRNPQVEMWREGQPVVDEDLLTATVGDLALWTKGDRQIIDVAVVGIDSPSLRWALRGVEKLSIVGYLPPETQPSIVITPEQQTVSLSNAYRGQDFVWTRRPAWSVFLDGEWLRWLLKREAPAEKTTLILWARTDLFPGGSAQPVETNP